ncbi:MAG TPA: protein kinase [Pyrinomonadaceae bacterium]|nr:protein kinase [Pyrinomonadaceae bacterium]
MTPERWRQIGKLYQAALALQPDEREIFLDNACADDTTMRREVKSLLAAEDGAGSFLEAGAMKDAAKMLVDDESLLLVGKQLGHYQVLSMLGSGGMGEVYFAEDTLLKRKVALKLLPAELTANPDRLRRFEQEAQAASALNHPNIITIHEIGQVDGLNFIVTEFIAGETLRQRMATEQMNLAVVLDVATQVAAALAAAHTAGIIHRDLKPENIMLRPDGLIKVLDFGLAKLTQLSAASPSSEAPTRAQMKTDTGMVMGTARYMSPEQARGQEVDARTDIFSLGVVLYEMLTGRAPFEGQTASDVIAAVLKIEPPRLPDEVPRELEHIISRALRKDPERRYQVVKDLLLDVEDLKQTPSEVSAPSTKTRSYLGWIAAMAVLVVVTLVLAIVYFRRAPIEVRSVRSFILPPDKTSLNITDSYASNLTVSPDGRYLAFTATTEEGKSFLWVRPLDALSAQALAGTDGAYFPFWSPDSRFLGFFADGKLKKIEAAGGPTLTLADAPMARGGAWNRDGVIIYAPAAAGALQQISASGGIPSPVTKRDEARGEMTDRWPYFLPDGQHFLYLRRGITSGESDTAIYVASLASKESKLLVRVSSNVAYAEGYLLFVREGTLMAQAFDPDRLVTSGDAFPIARQVQSVPSMSYGMFAVSEKGVMVYLTGSVSGGSQLTWFDRNGKQLGALGDQAIYYFPQLSPDGKRVAVTIVDPRNGNQDVWLYELARGLRTRFTVDPADESSPVWSPGGSSIVFASNRKGHFDLYQKVAGGSGNDELLLETGFDKFPTSFSPDGRFLLYRTVDPKTKSDLWVLPLSGDRKPFPFLQTEFAEGAGQFSPDGRWIAYISDESRKDEIYVVPFPGPGGKRQISSSGGQLPKWRRDGKEIFYQASNNKLMAAEVNVQRASLDVGAIRPLFEVRGVTGDKYDVTANGQRFLINTAVEQKAPSPITLVINWTADLKR